MILEQLGWLRCGLSCFEDDKIVWHLLNFYSWLSSWILAKSTNLLVLRQYKNDSIVSLEISCIFTHRAGYWKSAAISKLANTFSQLSRFFVCSSQAICSTLGISNNLVKWLWPLWQKMNLFRETFHIIWSSHSLVNNSQNGRQRFRDSFWRTDLFLKANSRKSTRLFWAWYFQKKLGSTQRNDAQSRQLFFCL